MSDIDPENAQWVWDEVPHYRLNDNIIRTFLLERWADYTFIIELRSEKFRFWVPRKLEKAEKDALFERRIISKKG